MSFNDNEILEDRTPKWSLERKITLAILAQWYLNNWKERTILFNAYFRGEEFFTVRESWFSENILRSMWCHLKGGQRTNGAREIQWYETEFCINSSAWAATRAALEETARELGIRVLRRTVQDPSQPLETPSRSRVIHGKRKTALLSRSSSEDDNDLTHRSIRRRLFVHDPTSTTPCTNPNGAGIITSPCSSQKGEPLKGCNDARNLPRYAYRAVNSNSQGVNSPRGLRAGRFKNSVTIPPSPDTQSRAYCNDVLSHINSVPTGLSPFISVTRNLLRALQHGCKTAANFSIIVIDLHKVEELDTKDEPFFERVQSVKSLRLDSPDGYFGSGEYVIWGEVKRDAIVSHRSIAQIRSDMLNGGNGAPFCIEIIGSSRSSTSARNQIKKAHTPLTLDTGKAVGNFLRALRIPRKHLDDAVYSIITDWCFNAARGGTWRKNHAFMKGVREGFRTDTVGTFQLKKPIGSQSGDTTVDEISSNYSQEEESSIGDSIHDDMEDEEWANNQPRDASPKEHTPWDEVSDDKIPNSQNPSQEIDLFKLKEKLSEHAFLEEMEEVLGIEKPTEIVPNKNLPTDATYSAQLLTAIKSEPGLDS